MNTNVLFLLPSLVGCAVDPGPGDSEPSAKKRPWVDEPGHGPPPHAGHGHDTQPPDTGTSDTGTSDTGTSGTDTGAPGTMTPSVLGVAACTDDFGTPGIGTTGATSGFTTITTCGNVYADVVLGADLVGSSGCLTPMADGITIEGAGHTIDAGTGFAVNVMYRADITLRNVRTTGDIQVYGSSSDRFVLESSEVGGLAIYDGGDFRIENNVLGSLAVVGLYGDVIGGRIRGNVVEGSEEVLVDVMGGPADPCPTSNFLIEGNTFLNHLVGESPRTVYLRCSRGNTLRCNTIEADGNAQGLRMRDEADDNEIAYNTVIVNSTDRAALHLTSGNEDKTMPADNRFHHNVFQALATRSMWNQGTGGGNVFDHNLFVADSGEGVRLMASEGDVFDHNTFVNLAAGGTSLVLDDLLGLGLMFTNNVFAFEATDAWSFDGAPTLSTFSGDWNVYWDRAGSVDFGAYGTLSGWQAATSEEAASMTADPMFSDPEAGDFSLSDTSPAATAGEGGTEAGAFAP